MQQLGFLALLETDRRAARLEIGTGAAAGDLAVSAGARQPHLQVVGAGGGEAQIAAAEFYAAIGQFQGLQHPLGIAGELLVGLKRLFGVAEPVQLNFVELVQADQAPGVAPVGACLAAETGGVGHVFEGELLSRDHLITVQRGDRDFGGGGEPEVVVGALETLLGEFGQLARAGKAGAVHQDRRHHFGVAAGGVAIEHEGDQGPLQPGALAQQRHETALGDAHRTLATVEQSKPFGNLPVLFEVFARAGPAGVTPGAHLNVVGFTAPFGHPGVGQVGQGEQLLAQTGLQDFLFLFEARHLLFDAVALVAQLAHFWSIRAGPRLDLLPHRFADAVTFSLQITATFLQIPLLNGDALQARQVELDTAARQLAANQRGVIAQQALIKHGSQEALTEPKGRCVGRPKQGFRAPG